MIREIWIAYLTEIKLVTGLYASLDLVTPHGVAADRSRWATSLQLRLRLDLLARSQLAAARHCLSLAFVQYSRLLIMTSLAVQGNCIVSSSADIISY